MFLALLAIDTLRPVSLASGGLFSSPSDQTSYSALDGTDGPAFPHRLHVDVSLMAGIGKSVSQLFEPLGSERSTKHMVTDLLASMWGRKRIASKELLSFLRPKGSS